MTKPSKHFYEFGPFRLDPAARILKRGEITVPLKPKALDLLIVLVEKRGHAVSKEELLKNVWRNSIVEDNNLAVTIFAVRKALGYDSDGRAYIETVQRFGYRFTEAVREVREDVETADSHPTDVGKNSELIANDKDSWIPASRPAYADRPSTTLRQTVPLLGLILIIGAVLAYSVHVSRLPGAVKPFQTFRATEITNQGNIGDAQISPDGKHVAYVSGNTGRQSVWVRHLSPNSSVQIIPPSDLEHVGLTFSPDNSHVYFLRQVRNSSYSLYRIPVVGGLAQEVIPNVDSPVSFSPDGKRLTFVRRQQGHRLMIAQVDGSGEQTLAHRESPEYFTNGGPAWSPDGEVIACVGGSAKSGTDLSVIAFRASDGEAKIISTKGLNAIGRMIWLSDGSGLLLTAADPKQSSDVPRQIWLISYPGIDVRRITNDTSNYVGLSLTADSRTLLTVKADLLSSIWTKRLDAAEAKEISSGRHDGYLGVSMASDGTIVYASHVGSERDLWIMEADGTNLRRLTDSHRETFPSVAPNGKDVVFVSGRTGRRQIWKTTIDGSNPQQLTFGSGDDLPQWSADGRFIIYMGLHEGKRAILKVSSAGGTPEPVTTLCSIMPAVSPDGKKIACYYLVERPQREWRVAVIPFDGGRPLQTFPIPANVDPYYLVRPLRWSPDGRALTYIDNGGGFSNIWSLPLNGSRPRQMTDFEERQIFGYEWSRDGKQLVLSRGAEISDVVMITSVQR